MVSGKITLQSELRTFFLFLQFMLWIYRAYNWVNRSLTEFPPLKSRPRIDIFRRNIFGFQFSPWFLHLWSFIESILCFSQENIPFDRILKCIFKPQRVHTLDGLVKRMLKTTSLNNFRALFTELYLMSGFWVLQKLPLEVAACRTSSELNAP